MRRFFLTISLLTLFSNATLGSPLSTAFPVAPHRNVTIEWWYLNAHVRSATGNNLAIVGSFFRFGHISSLSGAEHRAPLQSYYLIYAITDIDHHKHYAYSLGDKNTLSLLQQAATIEIERDPDSSDAAQLISFLNQDRFPPPTKTIMTKCDVSGSPFSADYGEGNRLKAVPGSADAFDLSLYAGPSSGRITLRFTGLRPPMYVNGDGNTGLQVRTDMKYISLTRCTVQGNIDTGAGPQSVTGEGWFDHQWGNSWTTQSAGWDWWGVQLDNGRDLLFFHQLNLKTGDAFFPCATVEDVNGSQVTTHDIKFAPEPNSLWTSPQSRVSYPLRWTVYLPDLHITLSITPDMLDQEMPVITSGGAIWEGSCKVTAIDHGAPVSGVAYMELVGYNSPAVEEQAGLTPVVK
jgi:predicted secreted hydrolase